MRYAKRISIYILVGLLSVGTTCGSYAQGVYAFEWVGGAIAFEEALKWLLGAVGICAGVGFTHDMWVEYGDNFTDYCIQREIDNSQVAQWQGKLAKGILDKASDCWSAFLDWASGLISGPDSDFINIGLTPNMTPNQIITVLNNTYGLSISAINNQDIVYSFLYSFDSNHNITIFLGLQDSLYQFNASLSNSVHITPKSKSALYYGSRNSWSYNINLDAFYMPDTNSFISSTFDIVDAGNITVVNYSADTGSNDFDSLDDVDTTSLDIISSDLPDDNASEVAIPMPGVSTSDDTASASAYDDIVDAINDGTITLDDGITRIQELLRVIVYDTTTDDVIPVVDDPDSGEPVKKDDVIQDNKNNMGFTLAGLENVFPFCIPWDLYAFINILRADPVAPVFILPFPNPSDIEHPYQIRVDLSSWDDAMSIFRLAEDFLFIIGLAILTRSLIGAGGGDG